MKRILAAIALSLAVSTAHAETEIVVQYAYPDLFDGTFEAELEAFSVAHPEIKVTLRTPYRDYEDGSQRILREAVTNSMPDVTFQGLNRVRILADREIALPLDDFIAAEEDFSLDGYHEGMLAAGAANGQVYGLPFAISLPIMYYNLDLVEQAGGNPENLPNTWDEVIELAKKINDLGADIDGVAVEWHMTGNWIWQALVLAEGGSMMNADETSLTFDDEAGKRAINLLGDLVTETNTPNLSVSDMIASFSVGKLGIFLTSTSRLDVIQRQIADRFALKTFTYPGLDPEFSRLPAGGTVGLITATDPEKQKAAWEFLKFISGPVGGAVMVEASGAYMAPNTRAAEGLTDFYADNPNQYTAVSLLPFFTGWYAFPGENGLRITDVINDHLQSIMDGSRADEPEAVLADMAADVDALLPRR